VDCHRLVLVGDAHLGRESDATEQAFLAFLDAVPALGDGLLVTGDLFEFWFAWGHVIPRRGVRVVAELATLARRMPVAMVGGNHDRWGGRFWEDELGIRYAPGELRFTVGGRPALAVHGDGITESHWSGRFLHRVLRSAGTVRAYQSIHPDLGIWLVDRLSGVLGDRPRTEAEIAGAAEHQAGWARARLEREPELSLIVMGHTHRARVEEPEPGRHYVNPGAWFDGYRYATLADGRVTLATFTPP
jgi:UDP-2,3-diacylglucosamine hydrolase